MKNQSFNHCQDCEHMTSRVDRWPCCECDGDHFTAKHKTTEKEEFCMEENKIPEIDQDGDYTAYVTPTAIDFGIKGITDSKDIKDSGKRAEFSTGAVRDALGGKGRFDLLPKMTIWALAKHYEKGCQKYGDRNWEKGIPIQNYVDSATRHLQKFELGLTDENHLISAVWNLCCAYETLLRIDLGLLPASLNTLPYPLKDVRRGEPDVWAMHKNFNVRSEADEKR